MSAEIVQALRQWSRSLMDRPKTKGHREGAAILDEAADSIEKLRRESMQASIELETARRMLKQSEAERERIWIIVEEYRKANSDRAMRIAEMQA